MLTDGDLPPIKEKHRPSSSSVQSLQTINIKRKINRPKITNKNNKSSTIKKKRQRIIINEDKELVQQIDPYQNGCDFFKRKEFLKNKKNKIEENFLKKRNNICSDDPIIKSNQNKKEALEKLGAKNIERENEKALNEKKEEFERKKKEFEQIIITMNNIIKENDDIDIEIHILDNYNKYFQIPLLNTTISKENNETDKKKKKDIIFQHQNFLASEQIKRNERKSKLLEEKEENLKILQNLREKLYEVKKEIKNIRDNKKIIQKQLGDHYHLLLFEGINLKNEGLSYIIKKIWDIGMNVDISFMPPFLDKGCIDYLFTATKRIIEINKMKQTIIEYKAKFALDLQNEAKNEENKKNSDSSFFATKLSYENEKGKKIKLRDKYPLTRLLMEQFHQEKKKEEAKLTIKQIRQFALNKRKFSKEIINHFTTLEKLKFLLSKMQMKFENEKSKEIERIKKEFSSNDYERRYKVDINTVLATIGGLNNIQNE